MYKNQNDMLFEMERARGKDYFRLLHWYKSIRPREALLPLISFL
jgi:hypothetical protein